MRSKISAVLPNVWLGTSIENAEVTGRADALRTVPASIRFISFEPLIGPVGAIDLRGIHWAIVGGESGKGARPIREEWIDEVYDQCSSYDTVFFFKQWGTWGKDNKRRSKKANGRVLPWAGMERHAKGGDDGGSLAQRLIALRSRRGADGRKAILMGGRCDA